MRTPVFPNASAFVLHRFDDVVDKAVGLKDLNK